MNELAKNLILLGFGIASVTEEKVKEIYKNVLDKGESAAKESKYVKELLEMIDKNSDEMEKKFEDFIKGMLNKMNLVNKEELDKLEKKVAALEKKIKELQKSVSS